MVHSSGVWRNRFAHQGVASNTAWVLTGHATRLLLQAAYFILLARSLGANRFGAFLAAVALSSMAVPFSGCGAGSVLIMRVARDPGSFSAAWAHAVLATALTGPLLMAGVGFVGTFWFGGNVSTTVIVLVAVAELWGLQFVELCGQAFQAVEHLFVTSVLYAIVGVTRVGAVLLYRLLVQDGSVETWVVFYLGANTVAAGVAFGLVHYGFRPSYKGYRIKSSEMREGFFFALGVSSRAVYADVDKAMLGRMASLDVTGYYAAGYRAVNLMIAPVRALFVAAYPGFFRAGESGIEEGLALARRIAPWTVGFGLLGSVGLWFGAGLIPVVLGPGWLEAVHVVRWLSVLPLSHGIHYLMADALNGSGHHRHRGWAQAAVAFMNIVLNLVLIPIFGWRGAAAATVASELLLTLSLASLIFAARAEKLVRSH